MLKHVKSVWMCDSCGKDEEFTLLSSYDNRFTESKVEEVTSILKQGVWAGWVRDEMGNNWCPSCHIKKPLNKES